MAERSSQKHSPAQKVAVRRINDRGHQVLVGPRAGDAKLRESLQPAREAAERGMREVDRILADR